MEIMAQEAEAVVVATMLVVAVVQTAQLEMAAAEQAAVAAVAGQTVPMLSIQQDTIAEAAM